MEEFITFWDEQQAVHLHLWFSVSYTPALDRCKKFVGIWKFH